MSRSTILHILLFIFLSAAGYAMQPEDLPIATRYGIIFLLLLMAGLVKKSYSSQRYLGLEGLVLAGAAACTQAFTITDNIWLALLAGGVSGMALYAIICGAGHLFRRKSSSTRSLLLLLVAATSFSITYLFVQSWLISACLAACLCFLYLLRPGLHQKVALSATLLLGCTLTAAALALLLQNKLFVSIPYQGHALLPQTHIFDMRVDWPVLILLPLAVGVSAFQAFKNRNLTEPQKQLTADTPKIPLGSYLLHGFLIGLAGSYAAIPAPGTGGITPVGLGLAAMVLIPMTGRTLWKLLLVSIFMGMVWSNLAPSMTASLLIPVLAAAVQAGTPILFATLGAIVTERSGVLNLGVEGMMMMGAFAGFACVVFTGSPWLSLVVAGMASAFMASIHGTVCLVFRGSQVVSGLALTIFGTGLADYLGKPYIGKIATGFDPFAIPWLSSLPGTGKILFSQDALVYLSYLCIPLFWFFLKRTRLGLGLRSAGENPAATLASGLSPQKMRWLALLIGGFTIGLGGAYLSLAYTHMWTNSITAGRGWIAVALVIFAFWQPVRAMFGAYLFGGIWVFQLRLQASGTDIPSNLLAMLPYILTLVVLVVSSVYGTGRSSPAALGVNLEPGD